MFIYLKQAQLGLTTYFTGHFIAFLYRWSHRYILFSFQLLYSQSINGYSANMWHMFCSPNILLMCFSANISLEYLFGIQFINVLAISAIWENAKCFAHNLVCVCVVCNFSMSSLSSSGCAGSGLLASFKI